MDLCGLVIDSPIGELSFVRSQVGIVYVGFANEDVMAKRKWISQRLNQPIRQDNRAFDDAHEQLDAYFSGVLHDFTLPLDWSLTNGFLKDAEQALLTIPWGQTISYSELAARAGRPTAIRAAASACARNPLPLLVPCHRVIRSDGTLGGYGGGLDVKRILLALESSC